jgi:hypothetical protein
MHFLKSAPDTQALASGGKKLLKSAHLAKGIGANWYL